MDITIDSFRGEEFVLSGVITKNDAGYPNPVIANTDLVFVAKRHDKDTEPLVRHDIADSVTLAAGGAYTIRIDGDDTSEFTRSELLTWALWLIEPSQDGVVVASGRWRVALTPGP